MFGYLLVHEDLGAYLGHCYGLTYWSKRDPAGQAYAVVFSSIENGKRHLEDWKNEKEKNDSKLSFISLTHENSGFASMDECVKAGVEEWKVV